MQKTKPVNLYSAECRLEGCQIWGRILSFSFCQYFFLFYLFLYTSEQGAIQVATLSVRLIFAIVSACGLNFRLAASIFDPAGLTSAYGFNFQSVGPQLDPGYSAAIWALQYALQRWWCVTMVTTSIKLWRHSQSLRTALLRPRRWGCKILEKVNFFQTDDFSATSHLAMFRPCTRSTRICVENFAAVRRAV